MVLRIPLKWIGLFAYTVTLLLGAFGISYGVAEWKDDTKPFRIPDGYALVLERAVPCDADCPSRGTIPVIIYESGAVTKAASWATTNTLCLLQEALSTRSATVSVASTAVEACKRLANRTTGLSVP